MEIETIKETLRKDILCFLPLIQEEYSVSSDKIQTITNDLSSRICFSEGTISFFVQNGKIYFPMDAFSIFPDLKKSSHYGTEKFSGVSVEDYLSTHTSYMDYIRHVIVDGLDVIDYYQESLLHEVMHLCGGCGGSPLEEGLNELKTRELAQKYGLRIAAVGYQREVEIAKELSSIFGSDALSKITFLSREERNDYLYDHFGSEGVAFFEQVFHLMEVESKNYMKQIQTIRNPFHKAELYDSIRYSRTWNCIENYKSNRK